MSDQPETQNEQPEILKSKWYLVREDGLVFQTAYDRKGDVEFPDGDEERFWAALGADLIDGLESGQLVIFPTAPTNDLEAQNEDEQETTKVEPILDDEPLMEGLHAFIDESKPFAELNLRINPFLTGVETAADVYEQIRLPLAKILSRFSENIGEFASSGETDGNHLEIIFERNGDPVLVLNPRTKDTCNLTVTRAQIFAAYSTKIEQFVSRFDNKENPAMPSEFANMVERIARMTDQQFNTLMDNIARRRTQLRG